MSPLVYIVNVVMDEFEVFMVAIFVDEFASHVTRRSDGHHELHRLFAALYRKLLLCVFCFYSCATVSTQWNCPRSRFIITDWLCVAIVCQSGPSWRRKLYRLWLWHFTFIFLPERKLFLCVCKRFNNLTLDPVHCNCENIYFEDLTCI